MKIKGIRALATIAMIAAGTQLALAQSEEEFRYMRGSLCMMMVENPLSEFKPEIKAIYERMDIPNRFNDHRFGKVRVIKFPNRTDMKRNLEVFAVENQLGKRMVSKWFGHDHATDAFNTEILRQRGLDNATKIDIAEAMKTLRGKAKLEDMGENLISHTYWVVTDFEYKNHRNVISSVTDVVGVLEGGLKVAAGGLKQAESMLKREDGSITANLDSIFDKYEGYRMKATSYLFRLKWNDEVANTFYTQYYTEDAEQDAEKLEAYKADKDLFTVEYVGEVETTSLKVSLLGTKTKEQLIEKTCTRALDKNLAELQHKFADFRIKAPLVSVAPLKAYIGMKEDITPSSRYEVLLPEEDERGVTRYKRVGVIKPIKGYIWDNQFMAEQERTAASQLDGTYFETVSGSNFVPGMLIREMR